MFLDAPRTTELRQGDIISGIYFPRMLCSSLLLLGRAGVVDSSSMPSTITPVLAEKSKRPILKNARSFINLFYISQQSPLSDEKIIDYNAIMSVPVSEYGYLLSNKVLQMTDKHRIRLKEKMSLSYGRYTQEERDAGLVPEDGTADKP